MYQRLLNSMLPFTLVVASALFVSGCADSGGTVTPKPIEGASAPEPARGEEGMLTEEGP